MPFLSHRPHIPYGHKRRPEKRVPIAHRRRFKEAQARQPQGFVFVFSEFQFPVEKAHQFGSAFVGHAPKAGDDALGTRVGKSAGQTDDAFPAL